MGISADAQELLAAKLGAIFPHLDERQRRLLAGAEARALGHGGIRAVARAAGMREGTVSLGAAELESGQEPLGRVRRAGGGRKRVADLDPGLVPALLALVEPDERGDPMSPLRWTAKSLRVLAAELTRQGHPVSADTVGDLLHEQGFSLQGNAKVTEGKQHPGRDAQFRYINEQARGHRDAGEPVISVDAKKKEQVGPYANGGREWRPAGDPARVRDHDFPDAALGKAIPYGIYDIAANAGWVSVGTDGNTAEFAVESIRRWWRAAGQAAYPQASRLLITADAGGSNGYRTRAWKTGIAAFAAEAGLEITVCHFPPGTSKWNAIEHRLFSAISVNWRGRPLTSHEVIVQTIAATTTRTGLTVTAALDDGRYPTGIQITSAQMKDLEDRALTRHAFHGTWNYTLRPAPLPPPGPAPPAPPALAALAHPALTGMTRPALDALITALDIPAQASREQRLYATRGGPRRQPGTRTGPVKLRHPDKVLATILHDRLGLPLHVLAYLAGVHPCTISPAITDTRHLLTRHGTTITPRPAPLRTLADLRDHATAAGITLPATTTPPPQPAAAHPQPPA
jgi:DDE family transposase